MRERDRENRDMMHKCLAAAAATTTEALLLLLFKRWWWLNQLPQFKFRTSKEIAHCIHRITYAQWIFYMIIIELKSTIFICANIHYMWEVKHYYHCHWWDANAVCCSSIIPLILQSVCFCPHLIEHCWCTNASASIFSAFNVWKFVFGILNSNKKIETKRKEKRVDALNVKCGISADCGEWMMHTVCLRKIYEIYDFQKRKSFDAKVEMSIVAVIVSLKILLPDI